MVGRGRRIVKEREKGMLEKREKEREGDSKEKEKEEEEWSGGQRQRERDHYSGSTAPSVGTVKPGFQTEYGRGPFKDSSYTGV